MRRHGFVLLEFVVMLSVMVLLSVTLFSWVRTVLFGEHFLMSRGRAVEQGLWATDFMGEKIRNNLRCKTGGYEGNRYAYDDWVRKGQKRTIRNYELLWSRHEFRVLLYTGITQPITGGDDVGKIQVYLLDGRPVFHVSEHGLVRIAFGMGGKDETDLYEMRTAVLPYHDFYRVKCHVST